MRKSHVSWVSYAILSSELIKMIMNTQITKRWECSGPIIIFRDRNLGQIQFPVFDRWQKKNRQINGMRYGNSGNQREALPFLPALVLERMGKGLPAGEGSWGTPAETIAGMAGSTRSAPNTQGRQWQDSLGAKEPAAELLPLRLFSEPASGSGCSWEGGWREGKPTSEWLQSHNEEIQC